MQLTQRTRRRVLKAVLPLLVIVWASLPWLPCCQELPAPLAADHAGTAHAVHTVSAVADASRENVVSGLAHMHHETASVSVDTAASGLASDAPKADSDTSSPLCADVVKNHTEARSATAATLDVALAGPTLVLPVLVSLGESTRFIDEPPRTLKRRPLHLAKSVLLI